MSKRSLVALALAAFAAGITMLLGLGLGVAAAKPDSGSSDGGAGGPSSSASPGAAGAPDKPSAPVGKRPHSAVSLPDSSSPTKTRPSQRQRQVQLRSDSSQAEPGDAESTPPRTAPVKKPKLSPSLAAVDTTAASPVKPFAGLQFPRLNSLFKALQDKQPAAIATPAVRTASLLSTTPMQSTPMQSTPMQSKIASLTTPQAAPASSITNFIGNLIFSTLGVLTSAFAGPAVVPPGSPVTVRSSTLAVGDITVPADWYFPNGDEQPTGLIYFQHGALAVGPMYSYSAATLAQLTNSIVVAPTMSTNGFDPSGMWLGGTPLQLATADLFEGDRTALTDSASAAAGQAVTLPQNFVLVGHSLGGVFVTEVAGDIAASGEGIGDLKGVVLFDPAHSAGQDDAMSTALGKLPAGLPVLMVGSPPSYWNQLGTDAAALAAARQGQFVGVILDRGTHIDSMQGGNPLVQFVESLLTGFPQQQNVDAARILSVGWINDMFADPGADPHGIYEPAGSVFTIDTPDGVAAAFALPDTYHQPTQFDVLLTELINSLTGGLGASQAVAATA